jgi:hypothetical protein
LQGAVSIFDQSALTRDRYNNLPGVEAVNAEVMENDLVALMTAKLGPVFVRHGVHHKWGVYLVHHHWNIEEGEFPGEHSFEEEGSTVYRMEPVSKKLGGAYVPVTLVAGAAGLEGLEYSMAPTAIAAYELLRSKPEFLTEAYRALRADEDLWKNFGLGALRDHRDPKITWLEVSSVKRFSITREIAFDELPENTIQTSFRFIEEAGKPGICSSRPGCANNCIMERSGHAFV